MTLATPAPPPARDAVSQSARRRTFAIISHPDAGKTTLTEKFLLYSGAVAEAGAVKARAGRRRARSDWMEMERERGISITSTVLQFRYRGHVLNLLDTPGHRDFSEDTYRVLAAADAAIMVLDVAKGIEEQTRKLFEVCRSRGLPILTFVNKYDRPGRDPLELLDEIEEQISLRPTPVTWPVGIPGDFRGVLDRRTGELVRYVRTVGGSTAAPEEVVEPGRAAREEGGEWERAAETCALLDEVGATFDEASFAAGEASPLFVGSALTNFGVRHLLDAVVDLAPAPGPRADLDGVVHPVGSSFSGQVFKIQANMDPAHRDRVAFVRVCSGRFERGMVVTQSSTGKLFATKYATSVLASERSTIDEAFPGDVVGLVNAGDLRIGDTLYDGDPVAYPPIATFAPELFASVRALSTDRHKQLRRGLDALDEEGVVQLLVDPVGDRTPVLGVVGQMQFEVAAHRLEHEFGAVVELSPTAYRAVRKTDEATAGLLRGEPGSRILARRDGTLLALFESEHWVARLESDHPEWCLERSVV
ncbi:MAG: peptide chain release factor 3 [Actinomycetota bacterium]|nr:peptide chain release factor 3 [Actinomycetota bacterium]